MRSDFLVHWTGKDIQPDPEQLSGTQRRAFVDRLVSVLHDGFWMTKPVEKLFGYRGAWITYEAPITCFTEIRLSQTSTHARRYGLLGIGVTRRFVLDRFGGPVHYVRNHAAECVVGNLQEVLGVLNKHGETDAVKWFSVNSCFIKNMSNRDQDDFEYLEEQEWRIVNTYAQAKAGRIVATNLAHPEFRIPVSPGDVRIVVFPDEQTRQEAKADPRIRTWLEAPNNHGVILLTLPECEQF